MVGAGLLAKKAVERGLARKPWVKSSLAPGSKVVTEYYDKAGLTPYLEELGFHTVGYGCTTCIGNSGPLPPEISARRRRGRPRRLRGALRQPQLRGPHPPGGEGELPRLAAARRRLRARRAHGHRPRDRAARRRVGRRGRLPRATSGRRPRRCARPSPERSARRCSARLRGRLHGRRDLALAPGPGRRALRLGSRLDVRAAPDVLRRHAARAGHRRGRRRRALPRVGRRLRHDRPHLAGRLDQAGLAGRPLPRRARRRAQGLQLLRLAARQPRGDGARHVRERPPPQPARPRVGGNVDGARALGRGDDDLRRGRALPRRGHAARRPRRQGVRIRILTRLGGEGAEAARRARGRSPRATSGSTARTS